MNLSVFAVVIYIYEPWFKLFLTQDFFRIIEFPIDIPD
tara:strand:+ start:1164 stop:1277 length:114 start_codon:yes stop_codon:yes gene_type:complete